ncbi:HAD hydrolase-like protein [Patescibacteria group bacterium]|nr:HAD hydrolase-like protein [Patescibacteria group bacterium]
MHILNKKKIYLFDFDGVLADSVQVKTQAFERLYQEYGAKVVRKIIEHHENNGGMSRFEKFRYYHQTYLGIKIDDDMVKTLSKKFSKLVVDKVVASNEIKGATNFLEYCKKNRVICAVNSATPEIELKKIIRLKKWERYFQFVYGSPCSKVENIEKILSKTNFGRDDIVFFGDAKNDYNAAKLSHIDFIGINYSGKNKEGFDKFVDFTGLMNELSILDRPNNRRGMNA